MALKRRVLLVDPIPKDAAKVLIEDADIEVQLYKPSRDGDLASIVKDYDALIVDNTDITREVLSAGKAGKLKMVSQVGSSCTNLDLEAAAEFGVVVMNSPGYEANAVAEYTLAMMLALTRHVTYGMDLVKKGKWHKRHRIVGSELEGAECGVLGLGDDGRLVAKKAKALGMKVIVNDTTLPLSDRKRIATEIGADYRTLDEVVRESDYICLHLPPGKRTKGLIGKREFEMMKGTSYLINTASPGVVDEEMLYQALKNNVIRGAAIDAVEKGIVRARDKLLSLHNIIITPSFAPYTEEARRSQPLQAAKQVRNAIRFGAYVNVVARG